MHQGLGLFNAQGLIVFPCPNVRIGMPRRHTLGANHLTHHWRKASDHFVAGHGPRADATFGMTHHTFFLQQGRNRIGIADLCMIDIALGEVDQTAHGISIGDVNGFTCEYIGDGVGSKVVRGLSFLPLVNLSVVNWPAVRDIPRLGVDNQNFRCSNEAQGLANELAFVMQNRHVDTVLFRFCQNRTALILQV